METKNKSDYINTFLKDFSIINQKKIKKYLMIFGIDYVQNVINKSKKNQIQYINIMQEMCNQILIRGKSYIKNNQDIKEEVNLLKN